MNPSILNLTLRTTLRHYTLDNEVVRTLEAGMQDDKIKLFQLLQAIISSKHTDNRSKINFNVLDLGFGIYKDQANLSNEQIGEVIGRVGEHVRNLLISLDRDFNRIFSFVTEVPFADNLQLDHWETIEFIHIRKATCDKINEFSSTSFSQKFISRIIGVLLRSSHRYVGSNVDNRWNNGYLISKNLYHLDYIRFIKDLRFKLRRNPIRKTDSVWIFEDILSKYSKQRIEQQDEAILHSLKTIIDQEFEDLLVNEKGIIIPRSAIKTIPEYLDEAFDHLGYDPKGHTIGEVFDFLTESFPDQEWNRSSISGNLSAGSRSFRALGKTGAFVQKKWLEDGADIILGTIPEVALELLKREPIPINIIVLTEKISRYRRDMDIKSVTSYLSKKPGIAQHESFFGDEQNNHHTSFLQMLKSSKGSVANWKKYDGMTVSTVYNQMMEKGFPREQVDYMLDLKLADGQIQVLGDKLIYLSSASKTSWGENSSSEPPTQKPPKPQKDKSELVAKLLALEHTDGFRPATVRFEQYLLRSILFFGMENCACAICGRNFPIAFLVAAHIQKRSQCSDNERRDPNIVMPACTFGCDTLFEKGFICIDQSGQVSSNATNILGEEVTRYLQLCLGRECTYHNIQSTRYFDMHRKHHRYRQLSINHSNLKE